jgi:poly(3-hydroxybutyrate) depolymerase
MRSGPQRSVVCGGRSYSYLLSTPNAHERLPAILLLHGAGGQASDMLDVWKSLAAREHIVLIAPQLPRELWFEQEAPAVFRCVVADAESAVSVDSARVYLFGYSMGGYLAFDGAMFDSDLFAGTGVYAAAINEDYDAIVDSARRKMPIAIYIGDHDQFFSLDQVRRTRALLESHGFQVRYTELPNQDHAYTPVSDRVNADAWTYLSAFRLAR